MARKHEVICAICHKKFDLNTEQGVRHGVRRYAHLACYPSGDLVPMEVKSEEDEDLAKLKNYINNLFGSNANWPMIMKQIKKYKEEDNYTYSGMLKSLEYFYGIKKNPVVDVKTNGVGIIPFCYQDAFNYFYAIWQANEQNKTKINSYIQKDVIIRIPNPKRKSLKRKKFVFLDEEVINGE